MDKNITLQCFVAILVTLLSFGNVSANIVQVGFTGSVYQVPSVLSPTIFSNDSIRGLITYDTSAIPQRKFYDDPDTVERYWNSYTQVSLRIGTFELNVPNGALVDELGVLTVENDWTSIIDEKSDFLLFQVGNLRNSTRQHTLFNKAPLVNGYHLENFMFGFRNSGGTALSSLSPPNGFDPSLFVPYSIQFTFSSGSGEYERGTDLDVIFGTASISKVEVIAQTPLPAGFWLFGTAFFSLIGFNNLKKL